MVLDYGFIFGEANYNPLPCCSKIHHERSTRPRYVFDECIAYFGQNRIALAGYTTLQDTISTVLSNERSRIEHILNENLTQSTKAILLKLLESNSTFTDLAKLKRMAKDFSASQIAQELKTHKAIRLLYPEIKVLIAELKLSPKKP
jgi:hypothetical protein